EMLLARPTFSRGDLPELEFLQLMAEPQLAPLESLRSGVSPALADAMRRGLAADPTRRALTAEEMVETLRHETDLERAHGCLVAKLSRVRPRDGRGNGAQRSLTPSIGTPAVGFARPADMGTPTPQVAVPIAMATLPHGVQ